MELQQALAVAGALVEELAPYCEKLTVAGSIRRQRPLVNDIDLLVIPARQGQLAAQLYRMGCRFGGAKLKRFTYRGVPVDLYIATPDTFPMLLLVRTGSAAHNVALATRAKRLGLRFSADGRGILQDGARVAWRSEEEIFEALGMAFKPPQLRERP